MRVSVIIPVYNVERYLARCLDSVLAAVVAAKCETEIICVNDGSTDGSAAVLAKYADRVKIITKENGGLGSARNAGLDAMTGDYVTFVDSDDWIPECALAKFVEVAEASKAALVVSTSFSKDTAPKMRGETRWTMRSAEWIVGKKIQYSAWNKFYCADLFKMRRYPTTIYEDFPITTDIICEVGEFAAIDEPLYVYCMNAGAPSIVRSGYTRRKLESSLAVVRQVLEMARGRDAAARRFLLRQAADGHSSTVGQVWKSRNAALRVEFLSAHEQLLADYPEMKGRLSWKAAFRLWRMRRT